MNTIQLAKVARGDKKADLVMKDCTIVNVFSHKLEHGDIAIADGTIVGIGKYSGRKEVDLKGAFVCPGFIDGHVHIESSMLTPPQFAKSVVPKGTTTVIADPHEIANVCGIKGIEFMLDSSDKLSLDVFIMLPSCVPSTEYENSGAVLTAEDLEPLLSRERVLGLGEVMNYPGVINGNKKVHAKLDIAKGCRIDGHAPGIKGKQLNAYVVSGIKTDHECTVVEEMTEKISRGMYVIIREGSATRNLNTLINGVTKDNVRRILFCTDDKHPKNIKNEGHINYNVKTAISHGIDPIDAIIMATLNTAECYGLKDRGAIAPGYIADLLVLDNLKNISVMQVFKRGKLVAENDKAKFGARAVADDRVLNTVVLNNNMKIDLNMRLKSDVVKVIQIIEDNVITKKVIRKVDVEDGYYKNNPKLDILKMAVIERHKKTGNIGLGLVEGYGIKNGAVALTIAHDSHNIIVIGDNDKDMIRAVEELQKCDGGMTICSGGKVMGTLTLEVGGLMTDSPIEEVEATIDEMVQTAVKMGVNKGLEPFMTLSFLALPVIPELKLTDRGLFDVGNFGFVGIEE
ncbi:MAG: adenine deaminase [Clostridiales bacterium]|nr:adenine deaminase [Clostridiales bacterium]